MELANLKISTIEAAGAPGENLATIASALEPSLAPPPPLAPPPAVAQRPASPASSISSVESGSNAGGPPERPLAPPVPPSEPAIVSSHPIGEQQYSLRWNDYHTSILSSFRHLRDEEDFVDVTLACDGCSFTAHKVVLSACSPYFKRLLKANPCQHPIVILRDVKRKDIEALLRFMYNGEVNIGQEQLKDFLKTAQMLQVRGLADVPERDSHRLSMGSDQVGWGSNTLNSSARDDGAVSPPPMKRSRGDRYSDLPSQINSQVDHRESLLSQALEGHPLSVQLHSGDESNASDSASDKLEITNNGRSSSSRRDERDAVPKSEPSEYGEDLGEGVDQYRGERNLYPTGLLGIRGLTDLLPGPGTSQDLGSFVNRRGGIDMTRVRATDPRPCPKCGKIYRSAHTLRTHLEDKHTICPGYRCVLCGTVAKSRNSLHSHMSRQHRGISTKDLPVLPMPSPFDPELASRLLAKAGVRVSPAELAARASPTGPRRSDIRLDLKHASNNDRGYEGRHHSAAQSESSMCGEDPEDLSVTNSRFDALSPPNSSALLKQKAALLAAAAVSGNRSHLDAIAQSMNREALAAAAAATPNSSTGSALIDTYLQMIAETSALGITPEQQAALLAARNEALRKAARPQGDIGLARKERGDVHREHQHHRSKERRRIGSGRHGESSGEESDDYSDEDRGK
ncbi:protein abrupt-like [Neocloeon triangulifer]|uniref:protein abrupt-like n=1 Tax=Neocloeon triangulifer TaxID=2078957 RepID=UPI00286EC299|nr:protein abrupt-like [Neocloeon triangulifer]